MKAICIISWFWAISKSLQLVISVKKQICGHLIGVSINMIVASCYFTTLQKNKKKQQKKHAVEFLEKNNPSNSEVNKDFEDIIKFVYVQYFYI